jgi:hypothetical protein
VDKPADGVLSLVRKVLSFQMTIAEWIGTVVMLVIPYLAIGVVWLAFHSDRLGGGETVHRGVVMLATIASWPALLVLNGCLT